jgi:hypothetical protein
VGGGSTSEEGFEGVVAVGFVEGVDEGLKVGEVLGEGGEVWVLGEDVMEIKAPLRRISFKYQLGRLREHEQISSRMYSMDSFKSYELKQIHGGPLSMIHSGNKESLP